MPAWIIVFSWSSVSWSLTFTSSQTEVLTAILYSQMNLLLLRTSSTFPFADLTRSAVITTSLPSPFRLGSRTNVVMVTRRCEALQAGLFCPMALRLSYVHFLSERQTIPENKHSKTRNIPNHHLQGLCWSVRGCLPCWGTRSGGG